MSARGHLRRSHRMVDQWLERLGFYRKCIARDETCLFRIVSEQLYNTQTLHLRVREEVINYMKEHANVLAHFVDGPYGEYIDRLRRHLVVCGQVEISIVSLLYRRDVIIFNPSDLGILNVTDRDLEEQFLLCRTADDHFDGVFRLNYIENAAFCQSIVYKLLYENIFGVEDTDIIVDLMLHNDKDGLIIETNNNHSSTESEERLIAVKSILQGSGRFSDVEMSDSLRNIVNEGLAPFSFKVAKALDASIYRNIEFDSWNELRKEIRYNQWYKGGEDLTEGVRCLVKLTEDENSRYMCYIQKLSPMCKQGHYDGDEPCVVYIEELAQICTVRRDQLEPLPHATPWPIPMKTYRHLYKETCYNRKTVKRAKQTKQAKVCKALDFSGPTMDVTRAKTKKSTKKDVLNSLTSLHSLESVEYTVLPMYNTSYHNSPIPQPPVNGVEIWNESVTTEQTINVGPTPVLNGSPGHHHTIYGSGYEPVTQIDNINRSGNQYMLVGPNSMIEMCANPFESVNYNINRSMLSNGNDLPYHDVATLRFFFNVGLDYFRSIHGSAWHPYETYNTHILSPPEAAHPGSPSGPMWSLCGGPPVLMPLTGTPIPHHPNVDLGLQQLTLADDRVNHQSPQDLSKITLIKHGNKKIEEKLSPNFRQWRNAKNVPPKTCVSNNKWQCNTPILARSSESNSIPINCTSGVPGAQPPGAYDGNEFNAHHITHYLPDSPPNYVFGSPDMIPPFPVYANCFPPQPYPINESIPISTYTNGHTLNASKTNPQLKHSSQSKHLTN